MQIKLIQKINIGKKIELFTCYASCTLSPNEVFDVILLKIEKILIMEDLHKSHQILKCRKIASSYEKKESIYSDIKKIDRIMSLFLQNDLVNI